MSTIDWTTHPFIEKFKNEGVEEGRQEGRQTGLAEAKAEDLLKLIDARGISVTGKQREQVTASAGLAALDTWFDRALTAETAEGIFRD
ncbi:MAG: hypothetical protein J2P25_10100 [Nocardiopsaceae bacterium]|nr:hypothetical protein [Nocardiopsaceae bacterium]